MQVKDKEDGRAILEKYGKMNGEMPEITHLSFFVLQ